jgi:hypothetical protein
MFMTDHDDVRRRVALKILKSGMDTKEVLTRFKAEPSIGTGNSQVQPWGAARRFVLDATHRADSIPDSDWVSAGHSRTVRRSQPASLATNR